MSKILSSSSVSPTISALMQLGLAKNEAELYEVLINNPDATIPLLTEKSLFSRTMLYYILDNLMKFNLVTIKKNGKKTVYVAAPPEELEELIIKREREVAQQKKMFEEIKDVLGSEYRLAHQKPGIRFFEGKDGFKKALYDTLTAREEICSIVDADAVQEYVTEINAEYVKKRYAAQKRKKILVLDTPKTREYLKHHQNDELTETRFLPKKVSFFHTGLQIYDQKVLYQTLRADHIMSVLIHDPDIYLLQKSLFDTLWDEAEEKNKKDGADTRPVTVFGE